jgi:4'-phosphopantetheinyl transferase
MPISLTPDWCPAVATSVAGGLAPDEVHAWLVDLDQPPRPASELAALLSDDERERAARFHFVSHRQQFEVARGLLRWLLGHYTGVAPEALRFALGSAGKPALAGVAMASGIRFNLSHSGGRALLGVARGVAIGVDIEAVRAVPESEAIANSLFAGTEVEALRHLPADRRVDGFFACWTRKEAYVKAVGGGLAVALDGFAVSVDPDAAATLHSIAGSEAAAASWTLWGGPVAADAWAAIAVERNPVRLRRFCVAECSALN